MRRLVFILILVLLVGGLLAWQMQQESGYVLISYGNYRIDMSVWVALFLLLLVSLAWRGVRLLVRLVREPSEALFQRWFDSTERGRAKTAQGLLQFVEGRWEQSVKTLKKSTRHAEWPLVNCLTAAQAALELSDFNTVKRLLAQAEEISSGKVLAIDLMRAKLLLAENHYQKALPLLTRLYRSQPDHILILRMLTEAYKGLDDWENIEKLLPDFRRYKALPDDSLFSLEVEVYSALLKQHAEKTEGGASGLVSLWQEMPSLVRRSRRVMELYIECLEKVGELKRAEKLIKKVLKSEWDENLVRRYGLLASEDPINQLKIAENWLRSHPDSAELLLALGRLSQRAELWGKAKDYFESALSKSPRTDIYTELARLTAQLGDQKKSIGYYQKGLQAQNSMAST